MSVSRQKAADFFLMTDDPVRDVALVEGIAGRLQTGDATPLGVRRLFVDQVLDRAPEIGLDEPSPGRGTWPPGR